MIPRQFRESKYQDMIERAKKLTDNECLRVVENPDVSITAIMSLMNKEGYKVTRRTVDKKKTLYIYKKVKPKTTP